MKRHNSAWWSLELPDDWTLEQDQTCTTMSSAAALGVLQISAARNTRGPATDDDLKDFAKDHIDAGAQLKTATCGTFTGLHLPYSTSGMFVRQWWLRRADTVVFVTYTCDLINKGKEDNVVDSIMKTLKKRN